MTNIYFFYKIFTIVKYTLTTFTIWAILCVQVSDIKYICVAVQPSPASIPGAFHLPKVKLCPPSATPPHILLPRFQNCHSTVQISIFKSLGHICRSGNPLELSGINMVILCLIFLRDHHPQYYNSFQHQMDGWMLPGLIFKENSYLARVESPGTVRLVPLLVA